MKFTIPLVFALFLGTNALAHRHHHVSQATVAKQDLLIKLAPGNEKSLSMFTALQAEGLKVEKISEEWLRAENLSPATIQRLAQDPAVEYVQPNYPIHLMEDYSIQDRLRRAALSKYIARNGDESETHGYTDNPAIPNGVQQTTGADPLMSKQWGMIDIGVQDGWKVTKGNPDMIVAVIDTGVDYTHEDLAANIWHNPKEIPDNQIDDDNNGYVDDVIGWDFVSNDNKPYDLALSTVNILLNGGNPGHGTHCAGNIAAASDNGKGIAGVAPNVKIMPLRFLSEHGQGNTADAIKAIRYAVDNGAKVISNSWGSEGEDPTQGTENQALRDAIQYAQDHGVLFVAAAGNGHSGVGYDNDSDPRPGYPASYENDNIVSVAAINKTDQLGAFSNWGEKTVDIAAPGVAIFSTMVGNRYSDAVVSILGYSITWDGTSMATPHVAGAAALYWSAHPEKSWQDVKAALLSSAKKIDAMTNKCVSGGKLDVKALMAL